MISRLQMHRVMIVESDDRLSLITRTERRRQCLAL